MQYKNISRAILILTLIFFIGCKAEGPSPSDGTSSGGNTGTQAGGDGSGGDGTLIPGSGAGDGGTIGGPGSGSGDGGLISTFKPALVIRASGCIMCHAKVESNMITDFGYGNNYFFGQNTPGLPPFSGNVYGDHAENWQTAKIWGQIIVPSAPAPFLNSTLANYLRSKVTAPDASTAAPVVVEKSLVYIGAPTAARFLEKAGVFPNSHPQWKQVSAGAGITGIELAPGNQYVQNSSGSEFVCSGDVVVNSVLFLNKLQIRTTDVGCRLYVTGSVFIQGPITYLGNAANRNLQISSARAIILGLGPNATTQPTNTIQDRLVNFWTRASYHTRDTSQSTQEKLDRIYLDSTYISDLLDSSAQLPLRRNVSFERLLLNAPNVQSRYQGAFTGVIIAEQAIAALNQFAFKFDPVFERVSVLPLVPQSDFLQVE